MRRSDNTLFQQLINAVNDGVVLPQNHGRLGDLDKLMGDTKVGKTDGGYNYIIKEDIENADTIVTINSTVGMEALILGKKLKVLGRAIYKNVDEKRLIQYIMEYLIPVDYWGREEVSMTDIKKILARAEEG